MTFVFFECFSSVPPRPQAGVSMALAATLGFEGGCLATFDCGFETAGRNWMEVVRISGHISGHGRRPGNTTMMAPSRHRPGRRARFGSTASLVRPTRQ